MHCGSCINSITNILNRIGVHKSEISLERKFGRFHFDQDESFAEDIIETIEHLGYDVEKLSIIDGEDPTFH